MSTRAVVIAHRETLAAEGIAAALAAYPALVPVGIATTAAEAERMGGRADVVALDERLPAAAETAGRLRRKGVRVVLLGDTLPTEDDGEGGVRVPTASSVDALAWALVPGSETAKPCVSRLTAREREVLSLAAKGMVAKQTARLLGISPKTVEQHKTRIFAKLGVPNQAAAVALVTAEGSVRWSPSSI